MSGCGQAFCCGKGPENCERQGAPPSGQSDAAAERSAMHHHGDGRCHVCGGPWAKGGASFAVRAAPFREVCSPECAAAPAFAGEADPVVASVRADLLRRSEVGVAKYGTTLARTDLTHTQWLQHAYEECLDMACYLKRAMVRS